MNHHLCNLLSLGLKNRVLETTLELLICAVDDLTMSNLAYLTASVQPSWSVHKFLLLVYFLSWDEGFLVLGCCPSLYVTL